MGVVGACFTALAERFPMFMASRAFWPNRPFLAAETLSAHKETARTAVDSRLRNSILKELMKVGGQACTNSEPIAWEFWEFICGRSDLCCLTMMETSDAKMTVQMRDHLIVGASL